MTSVRTAVHIEAPAQRIYRLASDTANWPELLPHYRFVRVLEQHGDERTVEMAARRGAIPVRWTAVQRNDPSAPAIYFRHVSGWTKGMEVAWRFAEDARGTLVTIEHDVDFRFFIASRWIEKYIVGRFFIDGVAGRTLACMKRLAESDAR